MIKNVWCVIEPGWDRPFFSDHPPTSLERKPSTLVLRYEVHDGEPMPIDKVVPVASAEDMRKHALRIFQQVNEAK